MPNPRFPKHSFFRGHASALQCKILIKKNFFFYREIISLVRNAKQLPNSRGWEDIGKQEPSATAGGSPDTQYTLSGNSRARGRAETGTHQNVQVNVVCTSTKSEATYVATGRGMDKWGIVT